MTEASSKRTEYDEETDELVVEDRIEVGGKEYRVLDDGVE